MNWSIAGGFSNGIQDFPMKKAKKLLRAMLGQDRPWTQPGHFYSPVPDLDQIRKKEDLIWGKVPENIDGIDLNVDEQLRLVDEFSKYYKELPFRDNKQEHLRYYYLNNYYSYGDAIFLYSMIRHLKPRRIIEVGSGYSSAVMLDTNEMFFKNEIDCTFIEPFPERFLSLNKEGDKGSVRLISQGLQEMDKQIFRELQANDILFIDSTHVSKVGSDVNYIFFEILPVLNPGVYIHFHDIFYPFEYPKEWIYDGRAWNEAYILRAFLQNNDSFRIVLFNTFLAHFYRERLNEKMPLVMKNPGGSIWIRRNRDTSRISS